MRSVSDKASMFLATGRILRTSVHVGMTVSLSIGLIEVILVCLVVAPPTYSSFTRVLTPLAVTVGAVFLGYLLAWYLLFHPVGRMLGADVRTPHLTLALLLVTFFPLALLYQRVTLVSGTDRWGWIVRCLVALAMTAGGVMVAKTLLPQGQKRRTLHAFFGLALPFVLFETMLTAWVLTYRREWLYALPMLIACGLWALAVPYTVRMANRVYTRISPVFWLALFMAVVVVSPLTVRAASKVLNALTFDSAVAEHPVKRVILITPDTLRADSFPTSDRGLTRTVNMDRLARDGIWFSTAISPAPWTLPAVSSIMTGLSSPVGSEVRYPDRLRLPDTARTLAEYMLDAGYTTAAFVHNSYLNPSFNLSQGFHEYESFPVSRSAEFDRKFSLGEQLISWLWPGSDQLPESAMTPPQLTDLAIDWLQVNRKRDFFLWVHYLDPHQPFSPPDEFVPRGEPPESIGKGFYRLEDIRQGVFAPTQREREWIKELYFGEVRYVDRSIGRFLDALEQLDLYRESVIVLTSDHGEEFWDHGGFEHGHTLYNELLRVPLIIKLPGIHLPRRVDTPVSTQRILPTILDLCGIDYPAESLPVTSLSPLWDPLADPLDQEPAISTGLKWGDDRIAVVFEGWKYIRSVETGGEELYDFFNDPGETNSLVASFPERVLQARTILAEHRRVTRELEAYYQIPGPVEFGLDDETLEQLRSLGYIH